MLAPARGVFQGKGWLARAAMVASIALLMLPASRALATPPLPTPVIAPRMAISPDELVRRIYTLPDPDFGVFAEPRRRSEVYTPRIVQLAARMDDCYRAKYGMAELDFTFIMPGQDYDISSVHVGLVRQVGDEAEVRVILMNPDTPEAIYYHLRRIDGEWRVDDVLLFGGTASLAKTLAGPC